MPLCADVSATRWQGGGRDIRPIAHLAGTVGIFERDGDFERPVRGRDGVRVVPLLVVGHTICVKAKREYQSWRSGMHSAGRPPRRMGRHLRAV